MRPLAPLALLALVFAGAAHAADLRSINALTQGEFRLLAQDLAAASAFKGIAPARPLGSAGLELAASSGFTRQHAPSVWRKASFGQGVFTDTVGAALRVTKGLPLGFDVGLTYGGLDNAAANVAGAELRWSLVPGGALLPALGLRLAASRLGGIDNLRLTNVSYDLIVSKTFGPVTPYLSFGRVDTEATASGGALVRESFGQRRVALGGHATFGAVDLTLEGDLTGKTRGGSGRLGLRF